MVPCMTPVNALITPLPYAIKPNSIMSRIADLCSRRRLVLRGLGCAAGITDADEGWVAVMVRIVVAVVADSGPLSERHRVHAFAQHTVNNV